MRWLLTFFRSVHENRQLRRETADLRRQNFELVDQMRSIEWRLAMVRSLAVDVHAAHAIAFGALAAARVEPCVSSAIRHQLQWAKRP